MLISGKRLNLMWQPLGKTAGVVMAYNGLSPDEPEATWLLLTGLNALDDQAAIEAYEKKVAVSGISAAWPKTFRTIATAQRPLLVRFLNASSRPSSLGEKVACCFAASFFRKRKVLCATRP